MLVANLPLFDRRPKLFEIPIHWIIYEQKLNHPSKFYRLNMYKFAEISIYLLPL